MEQTNQACRPEVVTRLVDAALEAMSDKAYGSTAREVVSAVFSLALRTTKMLTNTKGLTPEHQKANIETLRGCIEQLYQQLPKETAH
jgi:hypothetical protein